MPSVPGAYAGRARFRPRYPDRIPPSLQPVIGRVVEVGHAGVAPVGDKFAGQALFLEWRSDAQFCGFLIPEEDLQFVQEREHPGVRRWEDLRKD